MHELTPLADRSKLPDGPYQAWSVADWHRRGLITEGLLIELLAELPDANPSGSVLSAQWVLDLEAEMDAGRCFDAVFPCLMAGLISLRVFEAAESRHRHLRAEPSSRPAG